MASGAQRLRLTRVAFSQIEPALRKEILYETKRFLPIAPQLVQ
jgi:hypothetical protein